MARSRIRAGQPGRSWNAARVTQSRNAGLPVRNRDARRPEADWVRRIGDAGRGTQIRNAAGAGVRLLSRASRRFTRVAGHAFSASVTTTDPDARPVPAPRPGTAAGRWRSLRQQGPGAPVLVIAALMVLIVAMLGVERVTGVSVLPDRLTPGLRPPPKKFPVLPASPPTDIAIGKIGLRAPVHQVGIAPDGTIAVPDVGRAGEAGWYDQGPTPGQYGPAVIVGHVDTTTGPAVFHGLKNLDEGDRVEVTRQDHSVVVFEVNSVERYDKDRLPVDEVFGDFSRPNLRLITCGGRWVGGETGYADNVVVYGSLVTVRGP
ncbi:Sortase family protein [Micromonospora rhizosphaerae]|uniref:Sortase family protein n=1 Tax=Micromonospora rhizosphaerae TaxID=568872 RepID=A0A1C6TBB0_9ACTN|nr:class F sortase [Micromonospora rhizosphaerae]SCL38947.1 Sortase family protein [Micromonospora rhizosphaerae]